MLNTVLTTKIVPVVMAGFLVMTTPSMLTKKDDVKEIPVMQQEVQDLATKTTTNTKTRKGWSSTFTDPVTGQVFRQYQDEITTVKEEEIITPVKKFRQKVCDKVINIVNKIRG